MEDIRQRPMRPRGTKGLSQEGRHEYYLVHGAVKFFLHQGFHQGP